MVMGLSDEQKKDAEILKILGQDKFTENQEVYRIEKNKEEFLSKATNKKEKRKLKKEYTRKYEEALESLRTVEGKKFDELYKEIEAGKSTLRKVSDRSLKILLGPIALGLSILESSMIIGDVDRVGLVYQTLSDSSFRKTWDKLAIANTKERQDYDEALKKVEKK